MDAYCKRARREDGRTRQDRRVYDQVSEVTDLCSPDLDLDADEDDGNNHSGSQMVMSPQTLARVQEQEDVHGLKVTGSKAEVDADDPLPRMPTATATIAMANSLTSAAADTTDTSATITNVEEMLTDDVNYDMPNAIDVEAAQPTNVADDVPTENAAGSNDTDDLLPSMPMATAKIAMANIPMPAAADTTDTSAATTNVEEMLTDNVGHDMPNAIAMDVEAAQPTNVVDDMPTVNAAGSNDATAAMSVEIDRICGLADTDHDEDADTDLNDNDVEDAKGGSNSNAVTSPHPPNPAPANAQTHAAMEVDTEVAEPMLVPMAPSLVCGSPMLKLHQRLFTSLHAMMIPSSAPTVNNLRAINSDCDAVDKYSVNLKRSISSCKSKATNLEPKRNSKNRSWKPAYVEATTAMNTTRTYVEHIRANSERTATASLQVLATVETHYAPAMDIVRKLLASQWNMKRDCQTMANEHAAGRVVPYVVTAQHLAEFRRHADDLQAEIDEKQKIIDELKMSLSGQRELTSEYAYDQADTQNEAQSLKQKIEVLKAKIASLQLEFNQAQVQSNEANAQLVAAKGALQRVEAVKNATIDKLKTEVSAARNKNILLRNEVGRLHTVRDTTTNMNQRVAELVAARDTAVKKMEVMQTEQFLKAAEVKQLLQQQTMSASTNSKLNRQIQKLEEEKLAETGQKLKAEASVHATKLEAVNAKGAMNNTISTLSKKIESLTTTVANQNKTVTKLRGQLQAAASTRPATRPAFSTIAANKNTTKINNNNTGDNDSNIATIPKQNSLGLSLRRATKVKQYWRHNGELTRVPKPTLASRPINVDGVDLQMELMQHDYVFDHFAFIFNPFCLEKMDHGICDNFFDPETCISTDRRPSKQATDVGNFVTQFYQKIGDKPLRIIIGDPAPRRNGKQNSVAKPHPPNTSVVGEQLLAKVETKLGLQLDVAQLSVMNYTPGGPIASPRMATTTCADMTIAVWHGCTVRFSHATTKALIVSLDDRFSGVIIESPQDRLCVEVTSLQWENYPGVLAMFGVNKKAHKPEAQREYLNKQRRAFRDLGLLPGLQIEDKQSEQDVEPVAQQTNLMAMYCANSRKRPKRNGNYTQK